MGTIYIGYPAEQYENSPAVLVELCRSHPEWYDGWQLRLKKYESDSSLNAMDFCSMVLQSPGPIVMLQRVQTRTVEEVRRRLGSRLPIVVESVAAIGELQAVICTAIEHYERGEPLLAVDVVVALLMIRKLDREHMWTGNSKGYMWVSDISKGRGLDLKYESRVSNVLNILYMHELVVYKTSNSKKKYALNPQRREEIYEILRTRRFPPDIEGPLLRNPGQESVRALDVLDCYIEPVP